MKVLVATQREDRQTELSGHLHEAGYEAVVAQDGRSACRELQAQGGPQIALLDWSLPDLNAAETVARVRANAEDRYTYCIVVADEGDTEPGRRFLEVDADDYVAHPFTRQELLARLRAARRIQALQDQLLATKDALRFETSHDGATGVLNRSGLREHVHREFERAARFGTTLGAVLVDLDHFRIINESFGYSAGDTVLREAALRLRNSVRGYDILGRYGADEFLIIVPETAANSVMALAERILSKLSSAPISFDGQEIIVTASIGVATSEDRTEAELLQAVETAMKQAKLTGRNSVEFARSFTVEATLRMMPPITMRPN